EPVLARLGRAEVALDDARLHAVDLDLVGAVHDVADREDRAGPDDDSAPAARARLDVDGDRGSARAAGDERDREDGQHLLHATALPFSSFAGVASTPRAMRPFSSSTVASGANSKRSRSRS